MNQQRLSSVIVALALLATSACSTTPAPTASAAGVECHSEKQTGSSFPVKVCTTQAQRDAQHDDTQTATDRIKRFPGSFCNPQVGACR
jgi:curli biogenesis system outer membrane secretion channel CsgG